MQLTLDSDEAHALATELAALTGESVAVAVIAALRERLDRHRMERDKKDRLARITALAADIRAHMTARAVSPDADGFEHDDKLRGRKAAESVLWERMPKA